MTNSKLLKSSIFDEALRLGFFKMGIASIRPSPCIDHFRVWLEQGCHGTMSYLQRQATKRENPQLVLANARTILALAMNYFTKDASADFPMKGRISRYAWGDDYHSIVLSRLKRLLDFIKSRAPSTGGLCYVDTGPIMEKIWGAETALGWMGKHTNLITRDQGSWFFIGVILLDAEIESDVKEKDFCGKCSRCIQACPTGAIVAPYVLDARLCISYLTIESRGSIPRRLRSFIGNRIYGCDDCQEVCPWNRFATIASEKGFEPRPENLKPELMEWIRITPREFKQRFKNSPILRATRDGFVRNIAVALGNSHNKKAVAALKAAVRDESVLVRSHAAWALGQIATKQAFHALKDVEPEERNPEVLAEIGLALENSTR
jgi:epoxyqueuosine reductase